MRIRIALVAALLSIGILTAAGDVPAAESGPAPAAQGLSDDGRMKIGDADRCPVCAMFPARQSRFAAAMTLKSGEAFYFCSNGCLLRTWLRPMAYLNKNRKAIDRLMVRDYFSGQPVDARKATWVAGSDVIGPMGPSIIALSDSRQLAAFKRRHGGDTVFRLDALDDTLWRKISQRELPPPSTE